MPIHPITLTPMQMAWLKSGVDHGPSALVLDGVASSLMKKGCMYKQGDGKFAVTDLGRQVVAAERGKVSTLAKVASASAVILVSGFLLLSSGGCAIQPRGPVVKHIITTRSPDGSYTREEWIDDAFGRGYFILTDPALAKVAIWHTNMPALGGCSHFTAGQAGITVDSNAAPIISAGGTAVGNIIGAAAKSAVK